MSDENLIDDWCFELGLERESWAGSGDFGDAYYISDDKIIKMTKDYNEFIQTFSILKKDSKNLPLVHDMRIFPNGELGILMECLDVEGVEDKFNELITESENQNVEVEDIEIEDSFLSDGAIKLYNDLNSSILDYKMSGVGFFDIHAANIGKNSRGNYVLFDQTKKGDQPYDQDLFREIKEKLKESYLIEEEYLKKAVPIEKIIASEDGLYKSLRDVMDNKISQTNEPIECMYNKNGDLQVVDGYHRLCERLLMGETEIDVIIGVDERSGFYHPVYQRVEKEDAFEIDETQTFGGLEEFMDSEILSDAYDSYLDYKKSLEVKKPKNRRPRP